MTVRRKILLACLTFIALTTIMGAAAWQGQQQLGQLATNLYDRAFVAEDFVGRANVAFASYTARQQIIQAEPRTVLPDILANLDIAISRIQAAKTHVALQKLRDAVARLPNTPATQLAPALASIADGFTRAAMRVSNNGLAQRDAAEAAAAATRQILAIVLAAAFAGAAATSWLLTRSVVPPLRRAAADMNRLCRGDVDGEVAGTGRRDEIGDVCRSIGAFRQALLDNRVQGVRFQAALDNMAQGLCLFDAQGRLIVHNPRFEALFGTPGLDATAASLLPGDPHGQMFAAPAPDSLGASHEDSHELLDGRIIRVSRQIIPDAGWVATFEDITEERHTQDRVSHMAHHDALTGLPNRVRFRTHIEDVLRRRTDVAILYLDLDGFKGVNDTLGHPAGDDLLRVVSARLLAGIGPADLVARLGGDEFAIVQAGVQTPADATDLATRLVEILHQPFEVGGNTVVIGTSIGIALADAAATADALLRNADIALYRAKAGGRGTWRVFAPEMHEALQARRRLDADLQCALASGQFEVFYQPMVTAAGRMLTGFEALLRWNHPQRGLILPADFIPQAEETGLIRELGAWVLARACLDAATWPAHVKVAVNLSPIQFVNGTLLADVDRALAGAGLTSTRLELEITESVLLQENAGTLGILHRLRASGIRISMDDFGTGYSSLSYLRQFPFDKIKIDQSFVSNVGTAVGSLEIIRAVVGLGTALGMDVLVEGVETAQQSRMLQDEGCHELQGYLFSRPLPQRDLPNIIALYAPSSAIAGQPDPRALPRLALARARP